jgi:hypothetical protein
MPGIWLSDDELRNTGGALWLQQQQQRVQSGQDWAGQQIARIQQQAAQQVAQLAPSPVAPPLPAPVSASAPVQATAAPAPTAPPPVVPIGGTPVAAPMPPVPGDLNATGIAPAPAPTPSTPTVPTPTPAPTPSIADVGQNWAQQQISNLLNPSAPAPSSPTPAPQPIPGLPSAPPSPVSSLPDQTSTPAPAAPTTAPATPSPSASAAPPDRSVSLQDYARAAAQRAGIDPNVFTAQIQQESGFNPTAKSPAGAIGVAQFMPGTAAGVNLDPTDPYASLDAAAKMDAQNLSKYQGDWNKTLAAYNAGGGNVDKYGGVPPFAETQSYVKTIMGNAQQAAQNAGTTISSGIDTAKQAVGGAVQQGVQAVNTAAQAGQAALARAQPVEAQRQFEQEAGLSAGDAYTACGPVAAAAFAATYGRNPSPSEAIALARQVGWNPSTGMAGVQSEVKLLNAMGIDAHATSGVDWANVGRDASGGNPVIIDTPGHYYYVDGYNQDTGQLHVGASGLALKGGSEWMTPDQINRMPQSGGAARAAIFADHPLAQQDGLAQSTAATTKPAAQSQNFMGGAQDAVGNALANAPIPMLGQSANQLGSLLNQNQQQLQQGRDLVGSILTPDPSAPAPLRAKADSVLQSVQDVGGQATQASQDLLKQGQNLLQGAQQAPQTVSDLLNQNALFSQGIPNIGGNLLEGAQGLLGQGQQALGGLNDILSNPQQIYANSPTAAFNQNLQGLGQDVLAPALNSAANALNPVATPDTTPLGSAAGGLSQANLPLLSGAADLARPLLTAPGVLDSLMAPQALAAKYGTTDSSQYSPEDQQKLADAAGQARMAVGGISAADWGKGFYKGGVIGSLNTMADVAMNSGITPVMSTLTGIARDAASFQPGRLEGRALGAQAGLAQWANNFLGALTPSAARPDSLIGRSAPGLERAAAYAAEGFGAIHGAFQRSTSELIRLQELGSAAGEYASTSRPAGQTWQQAFSNFMASPPPAVLARVQAMGDRAAMRGDLGTLTGALGRAVTGMGPVGDALFPVYRMGMNMASRLVEYTPLGAAGTAFDVARGVAGRGPYADVARTGLRGALDVQPAGSAVGPIGERLTNNIVGTALSVWLASQALQGNVTGSGPEDPDQRRVLEDSGIQFNSFRNPLDGQFRSWDKLPPALKGPFMAAGAYADAVHAYDVAQNKQQSAGPTAFGVADPRSAAAAQLIKEVGRQLVSSTPIKTFSNIYDALAGGNFQGSLTSAAADIPSSVLGGLVPESGLVRSVAQMTDPLSRQTLQPRQPEQLVPAILQNVQQNLPGLREQLPSRLDVLGREVRNPLQGLAGILPTRAAAGEPSPILSALAATGVAPSSVPSSIPYGPSAEIPLRPAEQQTFTRYRGQLIQQMASDLVNSAGFAKMPDYAQRIALQRVTQTANEVAGRMLLADIGGSGPQRSTPTGVLAPVQSYALPNSVDQGTLLRNQATHAALIQSLLGQPTGLQQIQAANAAAANAV